MVFLETLEMKYMGERLPASYLSVETCLRKLLVDNKAYPIADIDVVLVQYPDERVVRDALGLLSKWGKCSYFENDARLRDKVILDPQFLSKTTLAGLFRIEDEAKEKRENGIIRHVDLKVFWPDLAGRSDFGSIAVDLISLMEKFGVCFVVPDDHGKPFVEQRSIISALLPPKPLMNDRPKLKDDPLEPKQHQQQSQPLKAEIEKEIQIKFATHWGTNRRHCRGLSIEGRIRIGRGFSIESRIAISAA